MDRLAAMEMFVMVVEAQSLAAAAHRLGVSPPSVTRRLKALEDRLGVTLLHRTTRAMKLTEAGERYLEDCRRILADLAEAEDTLSGGSDQLRGRVSLTAPVLFGQMKVMPLVRDFLELHPRVECRVVLLDRLVHLVEEGIDIGVRLGRLQDSGLYVLKAGEVRRVVCASPGYLQRCGTPLVPEDLRRHRVVATSLDGWRMKNQTLKLPATLVVNSNQAALDTALAGWGVARLMDYQVADHVQAGRLRLLLEDHCPPAWPVQLLTQEGKKVPARVRALVDFLSQRLRA